MTPQDLKNYLIGHAQAGIAAGQMSQMADVAAEAGYAGVWGAYPWSVRRGTTTLVTVASQTYTVMPTDFESAVSMLYQTTGNQRTIDIMGENAFDDLFPYPGIVTGVPSHCKIVYETPQAANKFRAVWYPVPGAVYSLPFAYNRRAELAFLPNLPSWLLNAVVQNCLVLMESSVEGQMGRQQLAGAAIRDAIMADQPVTGVGPRWGGDPGWDDWACTTSTVEFW